MGTLNEYPLIISRLKFLLPSLTKSEKIIAENIISNSEDIINMSLMECAKYCTCGEATVLRLCRKIGFTGYMDFKLALASQIQIQESSYEIPMVNSKSPMSQIVDSIFQMNIKTLQDTMKLVSLNDYERACNAICKADNIYFFAIGDALLPCRYALYRFRRVGLTCFVDDDADMQIINAGNMKKNDVAIAISHSGETRHVVRAQELAKETGATTICLTQKGKSKLVDYSDIVLFNATIDNTVSKAIVARRTSEQAIIDVLYYAISARRIHKADELLKQSAYNMAINKLD